MSRLPSTSSKHERILKRYEMSSDVRMENGVREGKVVIGKLIVFKRWSTMLRFVRSPLLPFDIVVDSKDCNIVSVYDSDIVSIELLPMDEWRNVTPRLDDVENAESNLTDTEVNEAENDFNELQTIPSQLLDGRQILRALLEVPPQHVAQIEVLLAQRIGAPDKYEWPQDLRPMGRVMSVLHRDLNAYHVGRLADGIVLPNDSSSLKSDYYYRFKVYNRLLPQFMVLGSSIPKPYHRELNSYLFLLRIESTKDGTVRLFKGDFIKATVKSVIGKANSVEANTMAICETYGIRPEYFDDDVEACVPSEFKVAEADELKRTGRRDLRTDFACTIDSPTALDLDDSLSIRCTESGGYHLGVHIADVTHFVRTGTPLDEEARRRLTSAYFVDRAFPMLPKKISNDFCSLNPAEDKYSFSVLFEMDRNGQILEEWFGKSVIRSRCRLSYEQAQMIIDDKDVEIDVAKESAASGITESVLRNKVITSVKLLHVLAGKLRHRNFERGRLNINRAKLRFVIEDRNSEPFPIGFYVEHQTDASLLVQEFMLLVNTRVAEKIVRYLPDRALLCRHCPPDRRKVLELRHLLIDHGIDLSDLTGKSLQGLLNKTQERESSDAVCMLMVFCMKRAEYFANNMEEKMPCSHFALALPCYTHFTSPIRRYCDIVVHRQLFVALGIERKLAEMHVGLLSALGTAPKVGFGKELSEDDALLRPDYLSACGECFSHHEVNDIAVNAQRAKELSREASESSEKLFLCIYLQTLAEMSEKNSCIPPVQRTTVHVIEIHSSSMVLYSSEVAVQVEIGLRDKKQLFKWLNVEEKQESVSEEISARNACSSSDCPPKNASGGQNSNRKTETQRQKNNLEKGGPPQNRGARENALVKGKHVFVNLLWSPHPITSEEIVEKVKRLDTLVVELRIDNTGGRMSLDMVVLPPWERELYEKSKFNIPTSLLE